MITPCLHRMPRGKSCEDPAVFHNAGIAQWWFWSQEISKEIHPRNGFQLYHVDSWKTIGHGPCWVPYEIWGL